MARRGRVIPGPLAPAKAVAAGPRVPHPRIRGRTGSVLAAVGVREVVSVPAVVNVRAAVGAAEGSA